MHRYTGKLRKQHWQAVKCIFKYLKGTTDIGLVYQGDISCVPAGYLDSDYAANFDARRSVTRYAFIIGNSLVSLKATLQLMIVLYTTKAKYMVLVEETKEGIWLKGLISNLMFPQDKAIIYCDSLSATCLAKDQAHHGRSKHIDHFIHTKKHIAI